MPRIGVFLLCSLILASPALSKPFHFVALGDTAYNLPDDYPRLPSTHRNHQRNQSRIHDSRRRYLGCHGVQR